MVEQLSLFDLTNYEEEKKEQEKRKNIALRLETLRAEKEEFFNQKLTTRQHRLRDYIDDNFAPGKWFTIEELCAADLGYTLNKNPKIHDKCAALGSDIRAINWAIADRYKIIIKNKEGSCKLAESEEEFKAWRQGELDKLERKWKYLNNLKWKAERDGTVPVVNLNDRALTPSEVKVVEVYKHE